MRQHTAFLAAISILISTGSVQGQTVLYVDDDATGANDGSSWCDAYTFLQDALAAAAASGGEVTEIRVAQGTYKPDQGASQVPGNREATFQLVNGVGLMGAYAGCGAADPDERDIARYESMLSGDLSEDDGPDFANRTDNSYHVITGSGTDPTAVIDGCTITGGHADMLDTQSIGGGMYNDSGSPSILSCIFTRNSAMHGGGMYNAMSNPTIDGCAFLDNRADLGVSISGGAGMFNYESNPHITGCTFDGNITTWNRDGGAMQNTHNSSPTITDCTFSNNEGDAGGAVYNDDESSPLITRCSFINNLGARGGGALVNLFRSCATVIDCLFHGNSTDGSSAGGWGGATLEDPGMGCSSSFINCTFSGNTAANTGGAIWIKTGSAEFTGCTFSANSARSSGGAFWSVLNAQPILTNCILWGNSPEEFAGNYLNPPTISFTNIQGGYVGTGNIDTDPLFVDADGDDNVLGTLDDDLRLSSGSPCIDAGDNSVLSNCARDLDGNFRFMDDLGTPDSGSGRAPVVDMGAYEFMGMIFDCNGNDVHDECDIEEEASQDCNGNVVPDDCEVPPLCPTCPDCNANGAPDECELSGNDCDGNGVPDECQPDEDCNLNDIQDICDIAACDGDPDCGDCSKNGVPDWCDIDSGTLTDANEDGFPDECEAQTPTMAAPPHHDAPKNRYVSIDPNNIGTVGLQVQMTSMKRCSGYLARACTVDDDCEASVPGSGTCIEHSDVGTAGPWWVQDPQQEPLGCIPGPCGDEDWFARVGGTPYFDTWTLDTLHIGDCEIIPVASYEIRACAPPDGLVCSDPLIIGTIAQPFVSPGFRGNYGDAVGPVDAITEEFTAPDGFTNVIDVSAYILTKQNYGTANKPQTHPTWVDLHGNGAGNPPQYILGVSDLQQILKAYAGDTWTDDPGNMNPGQCP